MGRRKRGNPAPLIRFEHVDTGYVETLPEGSVAAERLDSAEEWKRLDGDGGEPAEVEVKASEAAAKLADAHDIDLSEVEGTGKDGAITKADVQAAIDDEDGDGGEAAE